ncbi:MAG TPA: hypothetical protein VME41_05560 [Stellaceae bacterium]|nr:hypothetical protein [Stellaceae bacterium]
MKLTLAIAGVALIGFVLPAAAQTEYWVVQNTHTRHCRIVSQRPAGTEMTVIGGNGVIYHTHMEAENAMRTVKVCHSD